MRISLFSLVLVFLFLSSLNSQDTIIVQTLTYDSTGRDYVFDFPKNDTLSYEKIIMEYSMRCKGAKVSTSADRNKGCGEWDYSCNTYITDSALVDSIQAQHPSHVIVGFKGDEFSYTNDSVYSYFRYKQKKVENTNIISENKFDIGTGVEPLDFPFDFSSKAGKSQFLIIADELKNAGLQPGIISALSLNVLENAGTANFLRIKIKQVDYSELGDKIELKDLEEVFFSNVDLSLGENRFNFYKGFNWDGASNLLIELSYTNTESGNKVKIAGSEYGDYFTSYSQVDDYFLEFSGIGKVFLSDIDFSSIKDNISISFWAYGNEGKMPSNTTAFEGVGGDNKRQVNAHLPWSNSRIYWDCGRENNSVDRIDKDAVSKDIEGVWNFWVFWKDREKGDMKIYKNGLLWHFGKGKKRGINIEKLVFGGSYNNNYPYYGFIDDFAIWDKSLEFSALEKIMYNSIDDTNTDFDNLVAYFDLNEKEGNLFDNRAKQNGNAVHSGLVSRRNFRGKDIFKGFVKSKYRPNITFYQGEYEQDKQEIFVFDSLIADRNLIYSYKLVGTDIVLVDSAFVFKAGESYVLDGDSGEVIDTILVSADSTIQIKTLDYYKKYPSKFEIMSFVTPYGIKLNLGPNGKTWQFDVTDFSPILKGEKRLSVEFGKYQEELDIRFLFIKGTPPRNVNKIQQIWRSGTTRKFTDIRENKFFEPRMITLDKNSSMYKIRSVITGHGQQGEFIPQDHFINLDGGSKEFIWKVWKECADNPVYPQGGTWIYDRSGWCPGAPTDIKEMEITDLVASKDCVEIDYGIYSATGDSRYIVNCQLVSYGDINFNHDACIYEIQRPSRRTEFARFNPICYDPVVVIQNTGASELTNLKIKYFVKGGEEKTLDWDGELKFLEKEEVTLPIEKTSFWLGDGSNVFVVEISQPNGSSDEYALNNRMESAFDLPDVINNEFILVFKSNSKPAENKLYLKDMDGNIIYKKTIVAKNHTYNKELKLEDGCYELEITDSGEDGLDFWANPSQGHGSLYFKKTFNPIRIKNFNSDFGKFMRYSFLIGDITKVDGEIISDDVFDIYPNPASGEIELKLNIDCSTDSKIEIKNIDGQRIHRTLLYDDLINGSIRIDLSQLPKGLYFVSYKDKSGTYTKKLVVQ